MPATHPLVDRVSLTFEEVLEEELIDIVPGCLMSRCQHAHAAALEKPMKSRINVMNFNSALSAVQDGLGITIMPSGLLDGFRSDLVVVPLTDLWARRRIVLCTKKGVELSVASRRFLRNLCPEGYDAVARRDASATVATPLAVVSSRGRNMRYETY
ncbi:MAG: LysR substrate-binding domain-containing protein [Breoghania sp.]|nr:LysR substrate-binding domain-containing protein [Breoghania sp.]MDJ0931694.1 LysR substrate-binding domain-containing protein [Breoghania sp.]